MLWDVDYTLVGADGLGTRLYEVVFREMFGRELTEVAPKAGRTDRAIVGDTLALAGVSRGEVDAFLLGQLSQVEQLLFEIDDGFLEVEKSFHSAGTLAQSGHLRV